MKGPAPRLTDRGWSVLAWLAVLGLVAACVLSSGFQGVAW